MAIAKDHVAVLTSVATGVGQTVTSSTGNCSVVCFEGNAGTAVTSVTDNKGNTYVRAGVPANAPVATLEVWYAKNAATAITQVTINWTGGGTAQVVVYDLSGTDSIDPLAGQAALVTSQNATTNPVGPQIDIPTGGGIVIAMVDTVATAIAASFALDTTTSQFGVASQLNAGGGTFNPSWTTASSAWNGLTVGFKSTAGKQVTVVSQQSGGASPITIKASVAGNLLIVMPILNSAGVISGVTDNGSGGSSTYVAAAGGPQGTAKAVSAGNFSTDVWFAANCKGGATQVTIALSAGALLGVVVLEVEGVDTTASVFNKANHADNQTAGASGPPFKMTAPSITPSGTGQMVLVGIFADVNAVQAPLADAPFLPTMNSSGVLGAWRVINSATGSYNVSWDSTTSADPYCASLVAFVVPSPLPGDTITQSAQWQVNVS